MPLRCLKDVVCLLEHVESASENKTSAQRTPAPTCGRMLISPSCYLRALLEVHLIFHQVGHGPQYIRSAERLEQGCGSAANIESLKSGAMGVSHGRSSECRVLPHAFGQFAVSAQLIPHIYSQVCYSPEVSRCGRCLRNLRSHALNCHWPCSAPTGAL